MCIMVCVKVVNPHENAKRTLASLTEHALYDVSHHRSQKPLFQSVHTKTSISRFQKSPLRPPFSKPAFLVPETSVSGVDGRLKRKKKFRFYPDTYGRGLILAFILFQIVAVKKSGGVTLYDVVSGTAICHVKLPDPFCLSPQLPCICADGKILVLIGAQIDDENEGSLDKEVR